MLNESKLVYHYSAGGGGIDVLHNQHNDALANTIELLKVEKNPAQIHKLRLTAADSISQIKVTAGLLEIDSESEWLEAVTKLNTVLPEEERIYIPPSANTPRA